jgi:hypothetical protein
VSVHDKRKVALQPEPQPQPQPVHREVPAAGPNPPAPIDDIRFRTLVGERAWGELPEAVRRRFSKCLGPSDAVVYQGVVTATRLAPAGRVLSFLARAIGSPLPLTDGATGPAVVIVTEDAGLGGQSWLRIYARPGHFPQAIHSAKRFSGPTGLEEYVGCGIGMALRVSVEEGTLAFRSAGYFLQLAGWRLAIPRFFQPGQMLIVHRDLGSGSFEFSLSLTHRLCGQLVHQVAVFRDA